MIQTGIRTKFDMKRLEVRLRGIADAHGMKARVGVLEADASLPYKNGATVGDVARWTELGGPHRPARPFMRRARANSQARLRKIMAERAAMLTAGKMKAEEVLGGAAAELADETVRQIDQAASWAVPLAQSTIKRKGHDKPLTETHLLREAQSWEVVDAAGRQLGKGRPAR